jgi:hypothetical protein
MVKRLKEKDVHPYTDSIPVYFPLLARMQMKRCHNELNSFAHFVLAVSIGCSNATVEG